MASIAMMIGGALVNALAFTGSNFLFGQLSKDRVDAERKRDDLDFEQLSQAKQDWEQQWIKYINYFKPMHATTKAVRKNSQ